MENTTIYIVNVIWDVYGIESEDGQKVYKLIEKAFSEEKKVILSFRNIQLLTVTFLYNAVGLLYCYYTEDFIKENLKISDISISGKVLLKRVVETAKLYCKDRIAYKRFLFELNIE